MKELTGKMLNPRTAKPLGVSVDSWYYIGPTSIDIFIQQEDGSTASARLTRRQLKQALKIMSDAEGKGESR